MKEDKKSFPPSFLDRALLVVFSFSLSAGLAYLAYFLYFKENGSLILFLCLLGICLFFLFIGITYIINPARVELTNKEIIFISQLGKIKKCDWSEIQDFYFYYKPENRNPYKVMCFNKSNGKKFEVIVFNEKLIYEVCCFLNYPEYYAKIKIKEYEDA